MIAAVLLGIIVGSVLWYVSQREARRNGYRSGIWPVWIGPALGALVSPVAAILGHGIWLGVTSVPLAVAAAIMALTDVSERRVYDIVSLPTLCYVLVVAAVHGRIVDAIGGMLLYGGLALIAALVVRYGTADIYGVAIMGGAFGLRAWGIIYIFLCGLLALAAITVITKRMKNSQFEIPAFAAIFPSMLLGLSGLAFTWEARLV